MGKRKPKDDTFLGHMLGTQLICAVANLSQTLSLVILFIRIRFYITIPYTHTQIALMDNACFQPDAAIEMECVEYEYDISDEKEKNIVNLEKTMVKNTDCLTESTAGNSMTIQKTSDEIRVQPIACQADLCKETFRHIQQMAQKSQTFDPYLKIKAIIFGCLCFGLFFWSIVHFGYF